MNQIYMDNGATSFPKAPGLGQTMADCIEHNGANLHRGSYQSAIEADMVALETRELLGQLFGFKESSNIVFTPSITHSLNYIIKGLLKPGDHCLVSSMEHNAVMRPLNQMVQQGVSFDRLPFDQFGNLPIAKFLELIRENTKLVIMLQASNVSGAILQVEKLGAICRKKGIHLVLDTAQTAGHFDIGFNTLGLSALCFTGHKGLLGPSGIGGMLLTATLAQAMQPLIAGGTGSVSESEDVPTYMPDRFEAGTLNIPGIYGLNHALKYIKYITPSKMRQLEMKRTKQFLEGIKSIAGLRIIGNEDLKNKVAVVSLDFLDQDNAAVTYQLAEKYGIMTRCGLHCTPAAHQLLGTFPKGTVRFSFSHFTTEEEVDIAIKSVKALV